MTITVRVHISANLFEFFTATNDDDSRAIEPDWIVSRKSAPVSSLLSERLNALRSHGWTTQAIPRKDAPQTWDAEVGD